MNALNAREENNFVKRVGNKCPKKVKVARAEKKANIEGTEENNVFKDALYSLSEKFGKVSSDTTAAANVRSHQTSIHAKKEYLHKENADELKTVHVLFNDNDEGNKTHRNTLKKKRLVWFLEK